MASETNPLLEMARGDVYNGIILSLAKQEMSAEQFEYLLPQALTKWRSENRRGIHIIIPIGLSELIPIAARNQFTFHHAQPDYVQMNRWLPTNEPNLLPGYATHYVGVGGFVVNGQEELLAVKERYQLVKGVKPMWKFPGGHALAGEGFVEAGIREVFEETGVKCEFRAVLCFRHTMSYRFGCDDVYYVIWYSALNTDVSADPHEIAECKWIPISEYVAMSDAARSENRFAAECYFRAQKSGAGIGMVRMPHPAPGRQDLLVYAVSDTETDSKHKL